METEYITIGNTTFVYEYEGVAHRGVLKYRHETLEFHTTEGTIYTLPSLEDIYLIEWK